MSANPTKAFRTLCWPPELPLEPSPLKAEQTNTSVLYEDWLILKLFRRLEQGTNPDVEIGRFLTERVPFEHVSRVAGCIEYRADSAEPVSVAILQGFVRNEGDAWQYTLDHLGRFFEHVLAHPTVQLPPVPHKPLVFLTEEATPLALETIGPYLTSAHLLGQRTAELHIALASAADDPDFAPEPFSAMYQNSLYHSMRRLSIQTFHLLRGRATDELPEELKEKIVRVLGLEKAVIERFQRLRTPRIVAARIRCHGDYHLGQVLYTGKDFVIIDFEGEPARPLSERRLKRCPLRDVAGMIRSFHYATHNALLGQASPVVRPEDRPLLQQWGQFWYKWVAAAFLSSYLETIRDARLVPEDIEDLKNLLDAYLLEKAIYEIGYELNNRPDWVQVPLDGILDLIEAEQ